VETENCRYAFREIVEISIPRLRLRPQGFGKVSLALLLADGDNVLQSIPAGDQIDFEIYEPSRELFWP
jgi:hypothetical protein